MSDPTLGEKLMSHESTTRPASEVARAAIQRDRRRVRTLSVATILLWLLSGAGILVFHFGFLIFFLPKINELLTRPEESHATRQWADVIYWYARLSQPVVSISVAAMVLAASCTVMLIFASRRATLRQVNLSLAQICEQLKLQAPGV